VRGLAGFDFSRSDLVGISAMTGQQVKYGLLAAKAAREAWPGRPVVWGGVHPTLFPEQTAGHPLVDYVVRGEGEETLSELLRALSGEISLEEVAGLTFRRGQEIVSNPDRKPFADLDSLPLPAYDLIDMADYPNIRRTFDYQSSRGCPFRCAFCYNLTFSRRRWRAKSAGKVLAELEELKRRYALRSIGFVDDELFISRRRVEALAEGLIERRLGLGWEASCRVDILDQFPDRLVARLAQAGLSRLYFGAESGSQRVLDRIEKDISVDQIVRAAAKAVRQGIVPALSFIAGFPGETAEDREKTYRLINRLWSLDRRVQVNGVFIYNPYPGGSLFEEAVRTGIELPRTLEEWGEWTYEYEADLPWLTQPERRLVRTMFLLVRFSYFWKTLTASPDPLKKHLARLALLPLRLSLAIRWRRRMFSRAWEWEAFAWLMRRSFGYL